MTVGVAGLILGGGFGSFSKAYGTAAASLLEAEVVTADGDVKIANACSNPDLFWALKGGGGGFGVVTRVTLRTHALPEFLGGVFATIKASSDEAYRRLISKIIEFYAQALFNPHWGEQLVFAPGGDLSIAMVLQGLDQQQAEATWRPFFDWVSASPQDFSIVSAPKIISEPARRFWDPALLKAAPGAGHLGRPSGRAGGQYLLGRQPRRGGRGLARLPIRLAAPVAARGQSARTTGRRAVRGGEASGRLAAFQQGACGATADAIAAARDTAMNPAVIDAFALAISGAGGPPAYPGRSRPRAGRSCRTERGGGSDRGDERNPQAWPRAGSYVWETDYFQPHWQEAFWGENYARLLAVKAKYDPDGLFFLHHGVGSEDWSGDEIHPREVRFVTSGACRRMRWPTLLYDGR